MYTMIGSRQGYGDTGSGPKRGHGVLSRLSLMIDECIGRHIADGIRVTLVDLGEGRGFGCG